MIYLAIASGLGERRPPVSGSGRRHAQSTPVLPGAGGDSSARRSAPDFAGGIRNDTAANVEPADKERASLNLLADARQKPIESRDKFQAALDDPNAHLSAEQVTAYKSAIADLNGKLNDAITPAQAYVRSLQDQGPAARALTEGEAKLVEVQQRLNEQERSQPGSVTPAIRAQAIAAALGLQSAALDKTIATTEQTISSQDKRTAAYGQGDGAVLHATAANAAYLKFHQAFPAKHRQAACCSGGADL